MSLQLNIDLSGTIIGSVGRHQGAILREILYLHGWQTTRFDLDVTYGRGGFYRDNAIGRSRLCFDLASRSGIDARADFKELPLADRSVRSIMFDPPFLFRKSVHRNEGRMAVRYGSHESFEEMKAMFTYAIAEFKRILRPSGILVMKCQDQVDGRRNYWIEEEVSNLAYEQGFYKRDKFILFNPGAGRAHHHIKQQFARKYHCYFLIFKKKRKYA